MEYSFTKELLPESINVYEVSALWLTSYLLTWVVSVWVVSVWVVSVWVVSVTSE